MNEELKKQICDYFDAWELVEFLQISTEDVVDVFEDEIMANLEDVEELLGLRQEEEDE